MSDDLVNRLTIRLQEIYDRPHDFSNGQKSEAAGLARDRIEELESDLAYWQKDSADAWDKCEDNRVKLANAVEHFKKLRRRQYSLETFDAAVNEIVEAALAELTGGNDE